MLYTLCVICKFGTTDDSEYVDFGKNKIHCWGRKLSGNGNLIIMIPRHITYEKSAKMVTAGIPLP